MKILKMNVQGIKNFENEQLNIDFFAEKRVNKDEINENVFLMQDSFYTLNSLAFVGINASGKTTTLNIIHGILSIYIGNESINKENRLFMFIEDKIKVTVYLTDGNILYKVVSIIEKDELTGRVWFEDEWLFTKKFNSTFKKSDLKDDFDSISNINRKSIDTKFLKSEDSIFSSVLNGKNNHMRLFDTMSQTNFNYPHYMTYIEEMPNEFIKYLDDSIEEFKITNSEDHSHMFKIKFKGDDNFIICEWVELEKYLSSGTIKGLNILTISMNVLKNGGYIIIDELENHLNKRIIISILEFFLSDINKNGATLIFSTHYVELLDSIERSDSIYVLDKGKKLNLKKLSKLLGNNDRKDKKKSDIFLSGIVNTVPDYHAYMSIKNKLRKTISDGQTYEFKY